MLRPGFLVFICLGAAALPARAQGPLANCKVWQNESSRGEVIKENHYKFHGQVQVDCDNMQFFADEAEVFRDTDRLLAWGNVVFVTSNNRISADRMEFNTRTRTGTFFVASGIASMENRRIDRSLFGTQEPDAYFWGETIEKLGPKTYRVTRGGFTTCVQPTPRWEMVSGAATITLEDHAVLKSTLLKVKGVPLMYFPIMYYPINRGNRATGFLIPTYGTSTIKGQSISDAFFWAINRSQDATFYYDFFSNTGQGVGTEYRYIEGPGSSGNGRVYILREHESLLNQPDGTTVVRPALQSYQMTGGMSQRVSDNIRIGGSADYFSSLTTQQRYQQNIYAATNRTRHYAGNVLGNWPSITVSGSFDRSEVFYNEASSNAYGSSPRVDVTRPERPIGTLPLYFSAAGEYVTLVRSDRANGTTSDHGLTRLDFTPTLRFPFTRWPFLTFNSSLSWRGTFWTQSLDPAGVQLPESINRRYFDLSTQITGPVFTRIYSKPKSKYAKKIKHVIEPTFAIQRVTSIDNFDQIVKLDGADYVVGQVTRFNYGLNNRIYAKKDTAREIVTVSVSQSYYTDANAAKYDRQYQSSFNGGTPGTQTTLPPTHKSPVAILVHVTPTIKLDTSFRTEYDTQVHALRTLAANGTFLQGTFFTASAGWSMRRYIPNLSGFNDPAGASHYVNAQTTLRSGTNGFGGTYSFNYDLQRKVYLQQRYIAHYNTQCCGVAVEYQTFNYGTALASTIGVPQDHRFNLSFTLAGIGTFSNLLGSFGGQQGR